MQTTNALHADNAQRPATDGADPGEMLQRYLRRHGLRRTARRELILEVFLDMDGHPSPEEICNEVLRRDESVGVATIYRTLKLFLDSGIAKKQRFSDGLDRYEPRYGKQQHVHLICELCGRTMEIASPDLDALYAQLAATNAFALRNHQTCIYGVCQECAKILRPSDTMQNHAGGASGELRL